MNILIATDANIQRAGVCMFVLQWTRELKKIDNSHDIVIYFRKTTIDESVKEEFINLGIKIVTGDLPQNGTSISLKNRTKVKADVTNILNEKKFDIMHVNSSAVGFTSVVLTAGKKFNVPMRISHSHGKNIGNGIKNIYLYFLKKYNMTIATSYAGCSSDAGIYLFGKDISSNPKWHFIPNTIDTEKFKFNKKDREIYRSKLNLAEDDILLGATGMLIELKNHIYLLEIVSKLIKEFRNFKLLILGEGEQRDTLEAFIKKNSLDEFVFLPGNSNEIPQWLSAMDFYLMPSFTEGLPLGAVEAQTNGLPCILSDRIPHDVDLCRDVIHLPINVDTSIWINEIKCLEKKNNDEREKSYKIINEKGFGICKTKDYIKWLYEL